MHIRYFHQWLNNYQFSFLKQVHLNQYAVKLCKYYNIEYSDVDNDYITIFGLKHSLDKNLLSLLSSIEAIKASEKFTNSIPESNNLNRKILTKNKK